MTQRPPHRRHAALGAAAVFAAALSACGGGSAAEDTAVREVPAALSKHGRAANPLPGFVVGPVRVTAYDGVGDDLLTAGLGQSGLALALPAPADPLAPTNAELRRAAIYNNYRAIVDTTAGGGYGSLYGPAVGVTGSNDGRVAGVEYLAYSRGAEGAAAAAQNVTLMVQVPASFDVKRPCILTATSSGSRGVYGAIGTGEWGLKRGCAVAYTDKGTGAAPHDLANDTVALIDGVRAPAATASSTAHFRAPLSGTELAAFNAATPNRFAFKHAHSQRNPEKDWGRFTLQAVQFAFWVLNERYGEGGRPIRPKNTLVIASSVSNGGGAAIAAAEQDDDDLIDAVVVSEPQVQLPDNLRFSIQRGDAVVQTFGKTLFDYTSYANVYAPCAALSLQLTGTPFQAAYAAGFGAFAIKRCASLAAKGQLAGLTTAEQADDALAKMLAYGWERESVAQLATFAAFEIPSAISVTYANALSRASVADHLCGYSFAATLPTGLVSTIAPASLASMFATGNGIPPSSGVQLVNNLSVGAPLRDLFSFSPSTLLQDMNTDGALCLRDLLRTSTALQRGESEVRRSGNLRGRPALIVHGRDDALLPVNHSSRAYLALNDRVERGRSRLSYIEVTNAQHFDTFIGLPAVLPGFDSRYIPLHHYLIEGLDRMWMHLTERAPLPPSQLVRTTPRGGVPGLAPAIARANVPPMALRPEASDRIRMRGRTLVVPE